ncbi:MAG TPA: GerAB/ArcD/ProY family transporter [Spirochaetota bacterium]|nr:GerAB/ArcD/ProY family transporter [Spirochaetota bacterium]
MAIMILFASIMLIIALPGLRRMKSVEGYVTGNRESGGLLVGASLVATIIGASSTLGMADLARTFGGAAFWWLGLGAAGLLLMAWLTVRPLWNLKAISIADAVSRLAGRGAGRLTGVVIVLAWTGIIAAQLVAVGSVLSMAAEADPAVVILITGLAVTLYTTIGGQRSVIRTDLVQLVILVVGVLAVFLMLAFPGSEADSGLVLQPLLHAGFDLEKLVFMAVPLLGAYAAGPDMFSRINSARSVKAARRGLVWAACVVVCFGALITSLALISLQISDSGGKNPLLGAVLGVLPQGLVLLFVLGLVSAMVSSADTCLLTAGSILGCELAGVTGLARVRIFVGLTGIIATLLALFFRNIIGLMISSYAVYTAGIASPLVVALVAGKHDRQPRRSWFIAGMIVGGLCGMASAIFAIPVLVVWGTASSAIMAGISLRRKGTEAAQEA